MSTYGATASTYEVRDAYGNVLAVARRSEKVTGNSWSVEVMPGRQGPPNMDGPWPSRAATDQEAKVMVERVAAAAQAWLDARRVADAHFREALVFATTKGVGQGELL